MHDIVKNRVLVVSGVPLDHTPIVRALISTYRQNRYEVEIIEYDGLSPAKFIRRAISRILMNCGECSKIIFVGVQSLPLLASVSWFGKWFSPELLYWALETYFLHDDNSLVNKLLVFERVVRWNIVTLMVPVKERLSGHNYNYKHCCVLENVGRAGERFIIRSLNNRDRISFVFYGALNESRVYIEEFIRFVINNAEYYTLAVIGDISRLEKKYREYENVYFYAATDHDSLIIKLKENYHYSIVGYKPINFNLMNCAPNKLYEAMSVSLPVIANSLNPTLRRVVANTKAGVLVDFSRLAEELSYSELVNGYNKANIHAYDAYSTRYNLENAIKNCNLM